MKRPPGQVSGCQAQPHRSESPIRVTNVSHLPPVCRNVPPMSHQYVSAIGQCVSRTNDRHDGHANGGASSTECVTSPDGQPVRSCGKMQVAWWERCSQQCMQGTPSHREFGSNVAAKVNPCMLELQEAQERGEASREAKRRCRAKQGRGKGKGGRGSHHPPATMVHKWDRSPCRPNRDVPSDANQPTVQQLGVTRKGQSM